MLTLPILDEIQTAANRLRNITIHTPLIRYNPHNEIYLKPETLQPVKSFKLRGVFNAVANLSQDQREKGLTTISSGNTALALGWTAQYFGVHAKTYVPDTTPTSKIEAINSYGMEVVIIPRDGLMNFFHDKGWEKDSAIFIHPWHNRDLQAGHGTIGLEIIADLPEVKTVYIPVGGGGLISGVGNALKLLNPDIRVVGVESEVCASLYASFKAGKGIEIPPGDSICDGSAVPIITDEMYPLLRQVVDDSVIVSEKSVKKTMKDLILRHKLIVEGSGALATTAAIQESTDIQGKSVCLITGGTIDTEKLMTLLSDPSL